VDRDAFYHDKTIESTEWWVSDCDLPQLTWARLRVFHDGTADACWTEGGKLYGFDSSECAGFFLLEDEYVRFNGLDEEDEKEFGIRLEDIIMPFRTDDAESGFEYLGSY
jgi:hypothetical protein